ncbi:hypothetical protein NCH01_08670 [Neoasaia chiangmaiensis]|nr:hypothetical protein NCH01_08670 [Neoasaia chiangmaiensis]
MRFRRLRIRPMRHGMGPMRLARACLRVRGRAIMRGNVMMLVVMRRGLRDSG